MKKMFKTALLGLTALVVPFAISVGTKADSTYAKDIDTSLEYQVSSSGDKIRYISTMVLNNERTLNDIKRIDMTFTISKTGETNKVAERTTTKVYDSISGDNGKDPADNTYYAIFTIDNASKYNEWTLSSTFTYVFADDTTENATASSWLIGGTRLYFKRTYADWGPINAYMWKDGVENSQNTDWRGAPMSYDAVNDYFYYDYLPSKYNRVIFTGDSKQTGDITLTDSYNHYIQKNDGAIAVTAFNFTYDNNKHYCGDYQDSHILTGVTTGNERTVTCSVCGFEYTFDTTTIYLTNNAEWSYINVHMFNEERTQTNGWPGDLMTKVGTNSDGDDVYSIKLTDYADYIIFSCGGDQTIDIKLSDYINYNAFYLIDNGMGNKRTVGTYICDTALLTPISE